MHAERKIKPDESYTLTAEEALLASALALMTGYAQTACTAHKEAMATKIATNLQVLSRDPMLSPGFQTLLWSLGQRWQHRDAAPIPMYATSVDSGLWLSSPQAVQ